MTNSFVLLTQVDQLIYGGKVNHLAQLIQQGFNVPKGFVIPFSVIDPVNMKELAEEAWIFSHKVFGGDCSVAVRSSANMEDGSDFSFAGQFDSVLQVKAADAFYSALLKCTASLNNETTKAYCKSNGIQHDHLKLNILVQEMVEPDFSGVCFTVNPLKGNSKEMMMESVAGLAEQLVQGTVNPSSFLVNWYDETIICTHDEEKNTPSDKLLFSLTEKALEIQQFYACPQDIEWAIKQEELYILQARPMTAIAFDTHYDWTNADLKDGGIASEVATPFMYASYESAFESTMSPYLKKVKIHPSYVPQKWFTQFLGYAYWNLSAVKDGAKKIPGFVERDFDNDLGIKVTYEGYGHVTKLSLKSIFNGINILLSINKEIKKTLTKADAELQYMSELLLSYRNQQWDLLSDDVFLKKLKNLIQKDYLFVEGSYFEVIYNNSNNTTLFKDLLKKKNRKNEIQYLKLIAGLQNLSHLRPSFDLWDLSRKIRAKESVLNYFLSTSADQLSSEFFSKKDFPLLQDFHELMFKYGYHSERELNILVPNWNENPKQFFSTLKSFLVKKDEESLLENNLAQKLIFEAEYQKIKSGKLRKEILKHRHFLWLREEYRDRSTQMYDVLRKAFLQAGENMKTKGLLEQPEDVFFLSSNEIIEAYAANISVKNKVRKNKALFNSFKNYKRSDEIWSVQKPIFFSSAAASSALSGIACSYGVVEGEVYVALSISDAEKMPEGKIMVTKFTDPAWTVYFSKIKGLITETGGVLSHGAIISREYGIPAVLAVKGALTSLKTGMKIRLNGNEGTVEVVEEK